MKRRVFDTLQDHDFKQLLAAGLCATVNTDDPAYFGGYIAEYFQHRQQSLDLRADDIHMLARSSFSASFLRDADK